MWAVKSFWAVLFVAPWVLGNFLLTQQDTYLHSWMGQNVILSPPPMDYLLAYGLMLPFAVTGFATLLKREPGKDWFPAAWMLALPFLAYTPVNLQRRLVEGVWVAIVVLSLAAVDRYLENDGLGVSKPTGSRRRKWIFALAASLALPSTAFLLAGGFQTAVQPLQPAFRPAEEVAVFEQLRLQGLPSLAVLASYETGNALPAWTPAQVVIGHGPESAGLKYLRPRVRDFFSKSSHDSARIKLLRETRASHVFWGPAERALGTWDPSTATYLIEVYQKGDYSLYEVIAEKENDRKNGLFESVEPVSNR